MRAEEEKHLYTEQMIQAYLWHGKLCPALDECRMVLPRDGGFYERVDAAYHMLMTGEGVTGEDPVREVLDAIEQGDPYLAILHRVVAHAERTGQPCDAALRLLTERCARAGAGSSADRQRRVTARTTHTKHAGARRADASGRSGAAIHTGKKKSKSVNEYVEELDIFLTALPVLTRAMGVEEALAEVQGIVHGELRKEVRELRSRLASGEDTRTLCQEFLSELGLPEITSCMLACFERGGEGAVRPVTVAAAEHRPKKGKWKKGIVAALCVAVVGVMAVGVIAAPQGQAETKENRLRRALSQALVATVGEMPGVKNSNQLLAGFMQQMLKQVDDDIDLTVKICDMDIREQTLEVEAVGEYDSVPGGRRSIRVRRKLNF